MFKVGDFAEYIGNEDWVETGSMTKGKTYEIVEYDKFNELITIKNNNGNETIYVETFFKPITQIKCGDIVKFINEKHMYSDMTFGKNYKVINIYPFKYIFVVNNNGKVYAYPYTFFEKIEEKVEQEPIEPEYDFIPERELVYAYVNGVRGILIKK